MTMKYIPPSEMQALVPELSLQAATAASEIAATGIPFQDAVAIAVELDWQEYLATRFLQQVQLAKLERNQ